MTKNIIILVKSKYLPERSNHNKPVFLFSYNVKITNKTREQLAEAPDPKVVWKKFVKFVEKYNWKGTQWFAPIPAGFNIIGFDMIIIDRMCKAFGPWEPFQ